MVGCSVISPISPAVVYYRQLRQLSCSAVTAGVSASAADVRERVTSASRQDQLCWLRVSGGAEL